jgi:hypothetical protein
MAKILKSGSLVPMASLGKFAAAYVALVAGSLLLAVWAIAAFSMAPGLLAEVLGSWPLGLFGVGGVAAAGAWLGEGRSVSLAAGEAASNLWEVGAMASPIMVSPQVAYIQSRVK